MHIHTTWATFWLTLRQNKLLILCSIIKSEVIWLRMAYCMWGQALHDAPKTPPFWILATLTSPQPPHLVPLNSPCLSSHCSVAQLVEFCTWKKKVKNEAWYWVGMTFTQTNSRHDDSVACPVSELPVWLLPLMFAHTGTDSLTCIAFPSRGNVCFWEQIVLLSCETPLWRMTGTGGLDVLCL